MWAAGLQGAGAQAPWSGREPQGGGSGVWLQSSSNTWSVPGTTSVITYSQLKKALLYLETKYTGDWFCLCSEQAILCLDGMSFFPSPSCSAAALSGALLPPRLQSARGGISALGNSMLLNGWRESPCCMRQQSRNSLLYPIRAFNDGDVNLRLRTDFLQLLQRSKAKPKFGFLCVVIISWGSENP